MAIRWRYEQEYLNQGLKDQWRRACLGAGVGLQVDTVSGTTDVLPRLHTITGPDRFTVNLPPGMVADDIRVAASRLAPAMDHAMLRVTERGPLRVEITLLREDPLAVVRQTVPKPIASVHHPLTLGISEEARRVTVKLTESAHWITQGASGSGKSVGTYNFLGQLVDAQDVIVAGSDITGLLLGPWMHHPRHTGWQALRTKRLDRHVELLEQITDLMDERIQDLPYGADQVEINESCPLVLVVLEEFPGLLRLLAAAPKPKNDATLEQRARAAVSRLLAEGRKAGVKCSLIAQRADASVVGGFERGQASHTISYRVDNSTAVSMLHSEVPPEVVAAHASALPGVALLSAPGVALTRFRAPQTDYRAYCNLVAAAAVRAERRAA